MRKTVASVTGAVAAGLLLLGGGAPAAAGGFDPSLSKPEAWEYGGVYECSKDAHVGGRSYTKPSAVAFVVIRTGKTLFVSDLGDANEGDRTYTFDKRIGFVITCLFTDA